jgi:hypothetical protein
MKVEGISNVGRSEKLDLKGRASSLTRKHAMKGNGTEDKEAQGKKIPNTSKAWGSSPREIL